MKAIKKLLRRLMDPFSPAWIHVLTNPFWLSRHAIYKSVEFFGPSLSGTVIDFGCGTVPYRQLLSNCSEYVGVDYDSPRARSLGVADRFYDGETIPFDTGTIGGVLSTQSLEHVPNPDRIVAEWARVLKDDGFLLVTVPLMWPEHEAPWDFHRLTSYGLRKLLEENSFEVLEVKRLLPDCRAPAQLFLAWVNDAWFSRCGKFSRIALTALICPPVVIFSTLVARLSPGNSNTYLDNAVLARRACRAACVSENGRAS